MTYRPTALPRDDAMREADLVLEGYTVTARGKCMARIGPEVVMRDGAHRCVRVPAVTTNAIALGTLWMDFSCPASEMPASGMADMPGTSDPTGRGAVPPRDAALILHGYTTSAHGVCLARVAGHYVARDGVRRCIRFLVDTIDPVKLGTAWATFSSAAGWVRTASAVPTEILNQPIDHWVEMGEERRVSG